MSARANTICKACYGTSSLCKVCEGRGMVTPDVMTPAVVQALIAAAVEPLTQHINTLDKIVGGLRADVLQLRANARHTRDAPRVQTGTLPPSAGSCDGRSDGGDVTSINGTRPLYRYTSDQLRAWEPVCDTTPLVRKFIQSGHVGAEIASYGVLGGSSWFASLYLPDGRFQYGPFQTAYDAQRQADYVIGATGYG